MEILKKRGNKRCLKEENWEKWTGRKIKRNKRKITLKFIGRVLSPIGGKLKST